MQQQQTQAGNLVPNSQNGQYCSECPFSQSARENSLLLTWRVFIAQNSGFRSLANTAAVVLATCAALFQTASAAGGL